MAKQIAKLLKATIQDSSDLKQIAKQLAGKGRGGDSMLVHITPREASMLKQAGGAGTINPDTGLMEFYEGDADTYFTPSRSAGRSVDTDTYFSPRQPQTFAVPAPDVQDVYTPAGSKYDLMQYAPYTPAGTKTDLMSYGTGEFDPRTGGITPQPANVTGGLSLYQARPGGVGLRSTPSVEGLRVSPEAAAASMPAARSLTAAYTPVPEVAQALGREPTFTQRLKSRITSPETLEKLGLAGISAIPQVLMAQQARKQGQRAREELQALATPYRQRGEELIRQAQTGELSPVEQQQLQAMQARIAQGVAGRGGVGAEQAQVQLEAMRQQLLTNKLDIGFKVSQIADQIASGAIKTGLEADQYVNELTSNYFQTLGASLGGQQPFMQTQQPRRP